MHTLLIVLHVIFCVFLILVILLQTGKGAGIGAAFGGGSSQTVFGPRGAGSFIGKLTGIVATLFMLTSLTLAYLSSSTATGLAEKVKAQGLEEQAGEAKDVNLQDLIAQTTDEETAATDEGSDRDTSPSGTDAGTETETDRETTSVEPVVGTDAEKAGAADAEPKKPIKKARKPEKKADQPEAAATPPSAGTDAE